jgi:superoxide oxidase
MSVVPSSVYSRAAGALHWLVAIPFIASIGSVLKAQQAPKEEKGLWMFRHKSMGLLAGMLVAPRFAYRLFSRVSYNVRHLAGNAEWENKAGSIGHLAMYGFMVLMPVSGVLMGWYSGKGLPFFFTTLNGAEKPDGAIAKQAFSIHKTAGTYGKYLVPIHVGAAVQHAARGQAIFTRINPFRAARG